MKKHSILNELEWYSHQTINTTFNEIAKILKTLYTKDKIPNITEIANLAYTTPSSITRFCNQLGYSGYKEFINRLFIEFEFSNKLWEDQTIKVNWTTDGIFNNNFESIVKELHKINEVYYPNILKIAQTIMLAEKIYLFSCKKTSILINLLYEKLIKLGLNAYLISFPNDIVKMFENNIFSKNSVFLGVIFDYNSINFRNIFETIKFNDLELQIICSNKELTEFNVEPNSILRLNDSYLEIFYILDQITKLVIDKK